MFKNVPVISQNILLPIMGGVDITANLANNGGWL